MYSCLIAQKETKEKNKIKCILTTCDIVPEQYVSDLQENHCLEYQLLIYSLASEQLLNQLNLVAKDKKTGYGKHWYQFTDVDIASLISIYFLNGKVVFDFTSISDVMNHTLNLMSKEEDKVFIIPDNNRSNLSTIYHDESLVSHKQHDSVTQIKVETQVINEEDRSHENRNRIEPRHENRNRVESRDDTRLENRQRNEDKKHSFEIVLPIKNVVVTKDDYVNFIKEKCLKDKNCKIYTVKLNNHFIDYLKEINKITTTVFNPDEREELFKGFTKLGFEITEGSKRYYVQDLRLKDETK